MYRCTDVPARAAGYTLLTRARRPIRVAPAPARVDHTPVVAARPRAEGLYEMEASIDDRWAALQAAAPPRPTSAPSAAALSALKAHRTAEKKFLSELEPQIRERLTGKRPKAGGDGEGKATLASL
jgi:hypothetical protein